jgi:hypothetical protein
MPENPNQPASAAVPEDPYADAAPAEAETEKPGETEETGETALLPKNICPGMSPGDELVLKVVRVHGDQYEVSYSPAPKEEEEAPPEESGPAKADLPGEMSSMMED